MQIHVWGHMPLNLLHADPWSCWTSSARPLPALIEHTDVMLQPLYCHHTGANATGLQANQNWFQFDLFCRKCKLCYKSSLMKNPSKIISFHLSFSSSCDISISTKLPIFAQFRPLNKTEVFILSLSLSSIFPLYHTYMRHKILVYQTIHYYYLLTNFTQCSCALCIFMVIRLFGSHFILGGINYYNFIKKQVQYTHSIHIVLRLGTGLVVWVRLRMGPQCTYSN